MSEYCKMRRVWKVDADLADDYRAAVAGTKARWWSDDGDGVRRELEVYTVEGVFNLADGGLLFLLELVETAA